MEDGGEGSLIGCIAGWESRVKNSILRSVSLPLSCLVQYFESELEKFQNQKKVSSYNQNVIVLKSIRN